jgi:ADP-ribose pyrophosphatase
MLCKPQIFFLRSQLLNILGIRPPSVFYIGGSDNLPAPLPKEQEEQALAAAKRELREETGYISDSWEHLLTVPSDATLSDNYAHIYLAKDCRRSFDQELDRMEFLNVKLYTVREMEEMIRAGRFQQAVHVMAWYMARCLYIG